jgi:L-asparaginase
MRRIALVTTGGTIEKTYDEQTGELSNRYSIVRRMLGELRLEDTEVAIREVLSKDSLELTAADRSLVLEAVRELGVEGGDSSLAGVVVLHGTDTLDQTGELLHASLRRLAVPVVLTGAWRPFEMKQSDALQNLTESIFASGVLGAGVYCVAHGRVLRFPGVRKDRERRTFAGGGAVDRVVG